MTASADVTPWIDRGRDVDRPVAVHAPDRREPAPGLDNRDLGEGHLAAVRGGNANVLEVAERAALIARIADHGAYVVPAPLDSLRLLAIERLAHFGGRDSAASGRWMRWPVWCPASSPDCRRGTSRSPRRHRRRPRRRCFTSAGAARRTSMSRPASCPSSSLPALMVLSAKSTSTVSEIGPVASPHSRPSCSLP